MTTNQYDDFQEWATTGGGEGDPASSTEDIRTYVEGLMSGLGTVVFDEEEIPDTATGRAKGIFTDYNDLLSYLRDGSLTIDTGGGNYIPNSIVYILARDIPELDLIEYEVWIDENS